MNESVLAPLFPSFSSFLVTRSSTLAATTHSLPAMDRDTLLFLSLLSSAPFSNSGDVREPLHGTMDDGISRPPPPPPPTSPSLPPSFRPGYCHGGEGGLTNALGDFFTPPFPWLLSPSFPSSPLLPPSSGFSFWSSAQKKRGLLPDHTVPFPLPLPPPPSNRVDAEKGLWGVLPFFSFPPLFPPFLKDFFPLLTPSGTERQGGNRKELVFAISLFFPFFPSYGRLFLSFIRSSRPGWRCVCVGK